MSFWDSVHAIFDEDCFKDIASRVFSDAKTSPCSRDPKCFPPDMHSIPSSRGTRCWLLLAWRPRLWTPICSSAWRLRVRCRLLVTLPSVRHFILLEIGCSFGPSVEPGWPGARSEVLPSRLNLAGWKTLCAFGATYPSFIMCEAIRRPFETV
eukprot:366146-Chlamydomonas_euryale.AAC.8